MRELDEAIEAMEAVFDLWKTNAIQPHHSADVGDEFVDLRTALAALKRVREGAVEGSVVCGWMKKDRAKIANKEQVQIHVNVPPYTSEGYCPAFLWVEPNDRGTDE